MPVRSLNSAVLRWPDRETVLKAARTWAENLRHGDPTVERVLAIGSYARGDWGVGSDLDLVIVVTDSTLTSEQRYARYYPAGLPVPVDLWVYTRAEWDALAAVSPGLWGRLQREQIPL